MYSTSLKFSVNTTGGRDRSPIERNLCIGWKGTIREEHWPRFIFCNRDRYCPPGMPGLVPFHDGQSHFISPPCHIECIVREDREPITTIDKWTIDTPADWDVLVSVINSWPRFGNIWSYNIPIALSLPDTGHCLSMIFPEPQGTISLPSGGENWLRGQRAKRKQGGRPRRGRRALKLDFGFSFAASMFTEYNFNILATR